MTVTAEGRIMKVGNSLVMVLPKIVCDNYSLEKGNVLNIAMTDNGIFIPIKQNDSAFIQKELENALKSLSGKGTKK
jgi:antitoxin component of MazEF toxin-antitoxin module